MAPRSRLLAVFAVVLPYGAASFRTIGGPRPASRMAVARVPSSAIQMGEEVVVTEGSDSFYSNRLIFQALHEYGDFTRITAFGSSIANSKKMLLSRQARYSGLVDVLEFAEGELADSFAGATSWVAVNADPSALAEQLGLAQAAGVKRAFIHLTASSCPDDTASLEATLEASPMACTLMRTGTLSKTGTGGGLIVGMLDEPTCDEVPLEDVFRFITEAMTIPEAEGRAFSLCPSADTSQLKQMRMSGCSRREEVEALLKGVIKENVEEATDPVKAAAQAEEDARSDEEKELAREEELKELLARAKQRGIETQQRLYEEEKAKAEKRAERQAYFEQNRPDDDDDDGKDDTGTSDSDGGSDSSGGSPLDDDKPKKDDDDDDRLQAA